MLKEDDGPLSLGVNICEDGAAFDTVTRGNTLTETASGWEHLEKILPKIVQRMEFFQKIEHFDILSDNVITRENSLEKSNLQGL